MSVLADWEIEWLCENKDMIVPYVSQNVKMVFPANQKGLEDGSNGKKVISYGLSSYGYDIRVGNKFKIFTNVLNGETVVDPKAFADDSFYELTTDFYCVIPPNSFALAASLEKFHMPNNVIALGIGKSTYARCGIILNVTPLEPAWRGQLTLEISNTTPLPARIYANEGICQLVFFRGEPCRRTYADKQGKYQDQVGIVSARV